MGVCEFPPVLGLVRRLVGASPSWVDSRGTERGSCWCPCWKLQTARKALSGAVTTLLKPKNRSYTLVRLERCWKSLRSVLYLLAQLFGLEAGVSPCSACSPVPLLCHVLFVSSAVTGSCHCSACVVRDLYDCAERRAVPACVYTCPYGGDVQTIMYMVLCNVPEYVFRQCMSSFWSLIELCSPCCVPLPSFLSDHSCCQPF